MKSEISSAAMLKSDKEEGEKELAVEQLARKMKALCSTDLSESERAVEDYDDNESENELDHNNNNMHGKQDAAETESASECRHDESVLQTRSIVHQGNQSNSQDAAKMDVGSVASML